MAARAALVAAMCAVFAVAVAVASAEASAEAAQCDVGQLVVCAPAIIGGAAPSEACCANLKAQQGCFCIYARDPAYQGYINSPTARKAISSCGVPLPDCAPAPVAPAAGV